MKQIKNIIGFSSNNLFNFYAYYTSHHQFMMRSVVEDKNIDIIFKGVHYIECFTFLDGIQIEYATLQEQQKLYSNLNTEISHNNLKYYKIISRKKTYYIVALDAYLDFNKLPINMIPISGGLISSHKKQFPNIYSPQVVVLQINRTSGQWLSLDGLDSYGDDINFIVFENIDEAEKFCKKTVNKYPLRGCYIFNHSQEKLAYYFNKNEEIICNNEKQKKWWNFL